MINEPGDFMSVFKVEQKPNGTELNLLLSGVIDEDVQFPAIDVAPFKNVFFDLKDVKSINSVGIREWLNWITPIASKSQVTMKNCPKTLVFQFNMVEGFLPKGSLVQSMYVPFFCEKCDLEENVLFEVGKEIKVTGSNVTVDFDLEKIKPCKEASCELSMDVTEAKYFHFLKRASA